MNESIEAYPPLRHIKRSEWVEIAKKIYDSPEDITFRCPVCGHWQSIKSVIANGNGNLDPRTWIHQECEGRHCAKDVGCDWALYGLFQLHTIEVIMDKKDTIKSFEFAHVSVLGADYFLRKN